jgi:NAD+ synthetase
MLQLQLTHQNWLNSMKINNASDNVDLHPQLINILNSYRKKRNFNPIQYLTVKKHLIHQYFLTWDLGGIVFGLSGGIDSAVVLAMFEYFARTSPLAVVQSIVPATMHYLQINEGVSNQSEGFLRAQGYANSFTKSPFVKPQFYDLSQTFLAMLAEYEDDKFGNADAWARGQLATNLRTPAFYHLATIMSQKSGRTHVVSGTTNLDEAAYIGYFAKVGDNMVDIQPISDLHKSEVYTLADYLNVPKNIIRAKPSGDVFDGRNDLEMIGTNYDFVELHYYMANSPVYPELLGQLCDDALHQYGQLEARLDKLHKLNSHKYQRPNSVTSFDVMKSIVTTDKTNLVLYPQRPSVETNRLNSYISQPFIGLTPEAIPEVMPDSKTKYTTDIISPIDCAKLINHFEQVPLLPVGNNGYSSGSHVNQAFRSTSYDVDLAQVLFERLEGKINMYMEVETDYANFLHMPAGMYRAVGLNPMLRYIKYFEGGALVPHYDTEHNFRDDIHITLQSAIFYLTTQTNSGLTRFIKDKHDTYDFKNNQFLDWQELAKDNDVICSVPATAGSVLTFDHRILHDSSYFRSDISQFKAVFRTDVIYQFIGV